MWLVDMAGVCVWDMTVEIIVADGCGWWMGLGCDGCDFSGWWLWLVDVAGGCGRWMWPIHLDRHIWLIIFIGGEGLGFLCWDVCGTSTELGNDSARSFQSYVPVSYTTLTLSTI